MAKFLAAVGMTFALASAAGAVTMPAPLRNNTPVTGNSAQFTNDALYKYYDTDGTATTSNPGNGIQQGFLANKYSLTPVTPLIGTSNNVLPQLERAVIEFRAGGTTLGSGNRTYGFHIPDATTGVPDLVPGPDVFAELNTTTTQNATTSSVSTTNQINVPWVNFLALGTTNDAMPQPAPVSFEIARTGNMITFRIGDSSSGAAWDHVWSSTQTYFGAVNAIQLRMANGGNAAWRITDLQYNNAFLKPSTDSAATGTYQSDNISGNAFSNREIFLWDKVSGDFTLKGNVFLGWVLNRPANSDSNIQISLMETPVEQVEPIPEPASWAMMIAGFGLVGASMRRRRRALA